jgi:hypothetical protein
MLAGKVPARGAVDRRVAAGSRAVALARWIAPGMAVRHELDHEAPDEEIIAMAGGFSSIMYEWSLGVPAYASWYRLADHTAGYRYLRRLLQAMQWARPGPGRWVLKAPQHLEQLTPLLRVFPDATIVHTHRDPAQAVVSLADLITYAARTYVDRPDPQGTGRRSADLVERLLRAADRDRDPADPRYVDVYFDRLCADPIGVLEQIYRAAGLVLSPQARQRMLAWLPDHGRPKIAGRRYAPEDFGLVPGELAERFAFYYGDHPRTRPA